MDRHIRKLLGPLIGIGEVPNLPRSLEGWRSVSPPGIHHWSGDPGEVNLKEEQVPIIWSLVTHSIRKLPFLGSQKIGRIGPIIG